jgi:formate/nitrite transporter FocA (FNT family)
MPAPPTPSQIFDRAVQEGARRLDQSRLELTSNGFIAGFTIVFGIVALGIVQASIEPVSEGIARIAGAVAFSMGLVFLIVGRTELFTENFFDPMAAVVDRDEPGDRRRLIHLWSVTFALNLVGGTVLAGMMSVEGVLPNGTPEVLNTIAEEIGARDGSALFFKAVMGGALVALLSFLLQAVRSIGSRIVLAFLVGSLLALGPFDHVIVSGLHLIFGLFLGGEVGLSALARVLAIVTAGNLVGGIGLVTLTHIEQVRGERES